MAQDTDKVDKLIKKIHTSQRTKDLEDAKQLDFLEDPDYIKNAKKSIHDYVHKNGTLREKFNHFTNIFKQYSTRYNTANELYESATPDVMKTRRVEYVTTLIRFNLPDEMVQRMTVPEQAEHSFVSEIKLWGQKYAILGMVFGVNAAALSYISLFKNRGPFARILFSTIVGWLSYTMLLRKTLDKIYYPILPVFHKYRNIEKSVSPDKFEKIINFEQEITNTKSEKKFSERKSVMKSLDNLVGYLTNSPHLSYPT